MTVADLRRIIGFILVGAAMARLLRCLSLPVASIFCFHGSVASAQAPPLDLKCAFVEVGVGLYGEPTNHCFDMQFNCPAGSDWGCFKRELVFREDWLREPGQPDRRVTAAVFGYVDPSGMHWDVPAGYPTDGASIPAAFKPFIGGSWTDKYVKAAVLHDFYIRRLTTNPESVHRLFFHALLASDLEPDRAKYMYWAVRNFGPQWKTIDIAAYETARQANLGRVRQENAAFEAEYSACLEQHLEELRNPSGAQWAVCPLDGKHQFILDFMTMLPNRSPRRGTRSWTISMLAAASKKRLASTYVLDACRRVPSFWEAISGANLTKLLMADA